MDIRIKSEMTSISTWRIADHDDTALTLAQAALESGYSASHLGRLVRSDTIPNVGGPNAPRIRRKDLPRKVAPRQASGHLDRTQIVRSAIEKD